MFTPQRTEDKVEIFWSQIDYSITQNNDSNSHGSREDCPSTSQSTLMQYLGTGQRSLQAGSLLLVPTWVLCSASKVLQI